MGAYTNQKMYWLQKGKRGALDCLCIGKERIFRILRDGYKPRNNRAKTKYVSSEMADYLLQQYVPPREVETIDTPAPSHPAYPLPVVSEPIVVAKSSITMSELLVVIHAKCEIKNSYIPASNIIECAAKVYGVPASAIISKSKTNEVVIARNAVIKHLHKTGKKVTEIAKILGKDHSTIIFSLNKGSIKHTRDAEMYEEFQREIAGSL